MTLEDQDNEIPYELENTSDEDEDKLFKSKDAPKSLKDKDFRRYVGDSGVAESVVKLLVSLQQHKATHSEFLPLPKNEVSGVHELLYDYYGSEPDKVWYEIIALRKNNGELRDTNKEAEKGMIVIRTVLSDRSLHYQEYFSSH